MTRKIDTCIENMKKRYGKKEINIQMLNIVREDEIFTNSIHDLFSFEYVLRDNSSVWTRPSINDIKKLHELEDFYNIIDPTKANKFHLLDNSTHYLIIDTC